MKKNFEKNMKKYMIKGKGIEYSFINNYNKRNNIIDDKKEILQIVNKEIQVQIIANPKNDSKEKEISLKNNKKVIFNIIEIKSNTNHKKRCKKENKDNYPSVSESEKEKPKIKYSKYQDDNLRIKFKYIVLSYIRDFINEKIASIYKFNLCNGIKVKKLINLNKNQVSNIKIKDNKAFMKRL